MNSVVLRSLFPAEYLIVSKVGGRSGWREVNDVVVIAFYVKAP